MTKKALTYIMLLSTMTMAAWSQDGSVLASGQWWKMTVDEPGIYRLTTAEVPALQGVAVDKIGVYGRGGSMLPTLNRLAPTADMPPVKSDVLDHNGNGIFDDGDELLFYGEGTGLWRYNAPTARWQFEHHAYANHNHYYLTTEAPKASRIATAEAVDATRTIVTYTAVDNVDNDLHNIFASGQKWMGEKFNSATPQRTFHLALPASADGEVTIRIGLANQDYSVGSFDIATTDYHRVEPVSNNNVYSTLDDIIHTHATTFDVTLTFSPGGSTASGYLDFIELTTHAPLAFSGGQLLLRNDQTADSTALFRLGASPQGTRVWNVTTAGSEQEMPLADGTWSDSTTSPQLYVAFDGTAYLTPTAIDPLPLQNLHGADAADLVVVSHPDLLAQASRLAGLHEVFDGLTTLVVTDAQVYNEYSSGKQDPMAIRALLRNLAERFPDRPPRYLQLVGKGTYDNRDLLGSNLPTVVTYETAYSFDDNGQSFCSDDMMGYLDPYAVGSSSDRLDVSVGRIPAKDIDEAKHIVDKIERYITRTDLQTDGERGDWRNWVALLADDADPGRPFDSAFVHSNEVVARNIKASHPQLNIDKLYADAYNQSTGAIGSFYPDLNNALRQRMTDGCLLLNYIGHGSTSYIGTERFIELSDLDAYTNGDRLPLFVTSTCSYGRFDRLSELCGAEAALLAPSAFISVISAARPINHIERFNNDVVLFALDPANTIGDALRKAKNRTAVSQSIGIIGDPALRLSQPQHRVVVTHINRHPVADGVDDSATVLSRVTVEGEIRDTAGTLLQDFDGTIYPIVFDRTMTSSTLANDNPGTEVKFTQQKNVLYRGSHPVSHGRFEYSFVVPRDVAYQYAYAKLSHYARSGADDATGCYNQLLLGGMNDTALVATSAPVIRLFIGDTNFRSGGITDDKPMLTAMLADSAGINAGAGLGHDITAVLDGNPGSLVVLNSLFQPDVENPGSGTVSYRFTCLTPGPHTLTLKAWNIYNISSEATISFTVRHPDTLSLSALHCTPNPATDVARISIEVNNPSRIASALLQVYSPQGRVVFTAEPSPAPDAYTLGPVEWNVASLPRGIYLASIIITDTDGNIHRQAAKCIVY